MNKKPQIPATPMTAASAARIQSATAKAGNGGIVKKSFAARSMSAAAKNTAKASGSKGKSSR